MSNKLKTNFNIRLNKENATLIEQLDQVLIGTVIKRNAVILALIKKVVQNPECLNELTAFKNK